MENKSYNLLEKNLDQLLNRAFLDLDFNEPLNQQLVESIGKKAMQKTSLFPLKKIIFNKVVLLIAGGILAIVTALFYKGERRIDTIPLFIPGASVKPVCNKILKVNTPVVLQNKRLIKIVPAKKEQTKSFVPDKKVQEKIVLSGHVKRLKDGAGLLGAVIYKQHSDISVASVEQGYYSLRLPKGESVIVVSLLGYQTYTFSVYSDENISRDIELKEVLKLLDEVTIKPEGYIFPNLTEKQKRANEKEKQNMAKTAAKLRPGKELKYSFIPAPTDGSLPAFYMGSGEVSNLEYRTFLFDLLINGRKEDFLIAKPEQNLWINAAGVHFFDTLSRTYFSDKKYNNYPVVNISVAGAELYCRWLGELANGIRQKENKLLIEIRLPYEKEWTHAASGGRPNAVYPWPSDSVQNRVNWFLANCCIQKQADKLKYPLGHLRKFDPKAHTSAGMVQADNRLATVLVYAYNPNDFYLYCMSGNVSEMVYGGDAKTFKAKGGNWNSDFEHLKFNNDNEFDYHVTPSPMIGFRVCISEQK